ncbi:unnamed protein product [Rotaria sordida]|uniref:G-protein coupled receptors family 1 profile domain-containing protein n=3 Tax=Rotaria sordida TaxID=392033 RepID=A0A814WQK8_9BILA|nr:unnamed protein product [Rotaria sordida]CAF1205626.1 unnamed protein product [Rotaria sordida]CAF3557923.1 unnamed protein product [Rotaria sordida]CAF3613879.1 unnamed protein product [Rotaria sordida]
MNHSIMSNFHDKPSEWFRIFIIILFIIIVFIGLIGNTLVLLSVLTNHIKIRRSSTNLLLVNMSCADLIILSFNIFDIIQFSFDHSWPTAWYLGLFLCKIIRFFQVLGCYVSVQTLLVISIERYISIIHAVKISHSNRRKRLLLIFIVIWSIGIIMALPNLILLTLHPLYNRSEYYICGLSDHYTHSYFVLFYKYTESILFYFIPIFVQAILYILICRKIFLVGRAVKAHFRAEQLQCSTSDSRRQYSGTKTSSSLPTPLTDNNLSLMAMMIPRSQSQLMPISNITNKISDTARKRAIIMLLLVTLLYFIAFSPAQINFIYTQVYGLHHLFENRLFFIISILLVLSTTAFNPILFYIFSKFFRHKFNTILRRFCPIYRIHSRRQNDFPMI